MAAYTNYQEAYEQARKDAATYHRPMGLERATEYGRIVFRVNMVPKQPNQRFGWETRCQIVEEGE